MDKDRRRRFVAYFSGKPMEGNRAKFMAATGLTKGRVTQLLDEDEAFGERAARGIAEKLGLDPAYFERDEAESEWPFPGIDRAAFAALTHDQRMEIQGVVRERMERFDRRHEDRSSPTGYERRARAPQPSQFIPGLTSTDRKKKAA